MEVLEGNKLIAEFMGAKTQYDTDEEDEVFGLKLKGDIKLQYHTSWDWLMPVVEKIWLMSEEFDGHYSEETEVYKPFYELTIHKLYITTKIDVVYNSATKFIQWYNSLNGGQNKK